MTRSFCKTCIAVIIFFVASNAFASKIIYISPKRPYVVIDVGPGEEFDDDEEVCFVPKPEQKEPICGYVKRLKNSVSAVMIAKEEIGQLSLGQAVIGRSAEEFATYNPSELAALKQEEDGPPNTVRALAVGYLYTYMAPFSFSAPEYDIDAAIAGSGDLWKSSETQKGSPTGFEVSMHIPTGPHQLFIPGLGYRYYRTRALEYDFSPTSGSVYLLNETKAQSFFVYLDMAWNQSNSIEKLIAPYVGFFIDRSSVQMKAESHDDAGAVAGTTVASYQSNLTIFGLSLGARIGKFIGRFAPVMNARANVPLFGMQTVSQSAHELSNDIPQRGQSKEHLERAINHRRVSFGLEFSLEAAIQI